MRKISLQNISPQRLQQRIEKLSMPEPNTGCWIWLASIGNSGYGKTRFNHSDDFSAHRVSYTGFVGKIPDKMLVLHKCDNKLCVNPNHLFIGSHSDNSKDMVKKRRNYSPASKRTQCPKGHSYSGLNSQGRRICSICMKESRKLYQERIKKNG